MNNKNYGQPVRIERTFRAQPHAVFNAWIAPDVIRKWLFVGPDSEIARVEIDARPGGRFSILERGTLGDVDHFGEYNIIARPTKLGFTLEVPRHFPGVTRILIELSAATYDKTLLVLTQTGVDVAVTELSWNKMFDQLATLLEAFK